METYEMKIIECNGEIELYTGSLSLWHEYYKAQFLGTIKMERDVRNYTKYDDSPVSGPRVIQWSERYGGMPIEILSNNSPYSDEELLEKCMDSVRTSGGDI